MGPAAQPQQVDFGAMLSKLARSDMIIGGALVLLLIVSFIGSWFHYSTDACQGIQSTLCNGSVTYGSLWGGLGILAALLIVVGIAFLVLRLFLSTQVQLPALPLPDSQLWMAFGAVEVVLMLLNWLIGKGSYNGFDIPDIAGTSKSPGWALYVGVILGLAIIFGGFTKQSEPQTVAATPSGGYVPPPMPPSPPTTPMAPPPPPPSMNA
jgi:hypothetical protein